MTFDILNLFVNLNEFVVRTIQPIGIPSKFVQSGRLDISPTLTRSLDPSLQRQFICDILAPLTLISVKVPMFIFDPIVPVSIES